MNLYKLTAVLVTIVILTGCITRLDKPPPPGWTYYAGNGATQREIESAYLECGFPVPGDFSNFTRELLAQLGVESIHKQYAALAQKYYCMKNSGFPVGKLRDPCQPGYTSTGQLVERDYTACKAGAVIPKRSVENRISSPFCKVYSTAPLCQTNYDPTSPIPLTRTRPTVGPSRGPQYPVADRVTPQVQKDSNAQMNQLLQETNIPK